MEMLDRSKDFRGELLPIMSQFSQCGVEPRKHAGSRPMRLNIRRPFGHDVLSRSIQRNYVHLAILISLISLFPRVFLTSKFFFSFAALRMGYAPNELAFVEGVPLQFETVKK
jgi:hypothetical protein